MKKWISENVEVTLVGIAALVGLGTGLGALALAPKHVDEAFYAAVGQILPVFLVALAVEQRLLDRLGVSEDDYAKRAQ